MPEPRTHHLTLESSPESIRQVDPFLKGIEAIAALTPERYHDLLLAMTEAVNNAIIHGNRQDPSKPVTVDVRIENTTFIAVVTDEGGGFDPSSIPDPRDPENLLREGGRGVFLIQHLADSVEFRRTDTGMAVMLKVNL